MGGGRRSNKVQDKTRCNIIVLVKEESLVIVKGDDELVILLKDWGYKLYANKNKSKSQTNRRSKKKG